MRNFRKMSVVAAVFCIAVSYCIFAQDDLDDLLKDLESEAPKSQENAGEKAKEADESKVDEKAEVSATEEKPTAETAKTEEPPAATEEEKPAVAQSVKAEEKPADEPVGAEKLAEEVAKSYEK